MNVPMRWTVIHEWLHTKAQIWLQILFVLEGTMAKTKVTPILIYIFFHKYAILRKKNVVFSVIFYQMHYVGAFPMLGTKEELTNRAEKYSI